MNGKSPGNMRQDVPSRAISPRGIYRFAQSALASFRLMKTDSQQLIAKMPKKLTQIEVIAQFRQVHGDRYDYRLVSYRGGHELIQVICPVHGAFDVAPGHHKNGVGCRHCYFDGNRKKLADFILRAEKAHPSGRYDYGLVPSDVRLQDKVPIRCLVHGLVFEQTASAHVAGHTGCPECRSSKLLGGRSNIGTYKTPATLQKDFVERAKSVHGDSYDYSQVDYRGAAQRIKIICRLHGPFLQSATNHLRGSQCPKCSQAKKHQASFKARCIELGVDYHRALKRRQAGMTDAQVFAGAYLRGERKVNPITVGGIEYPNLEAAVRALDPVASSATIARWIEAGMSPDEAFAKIPNPGYANGIIYLVEHIASGRKYVGLTIVQIEERWRRHVEQAYMNQIKNYESLHAAIRKYGPASFKIQQIDQGVCKSDLEGKERYWINKLSSLAPEGFNISPGGGSGGAHGRAVVVDGIRFDSVRAAAEYVARTRGISFEAAKGRIRSGRIDVRAPSKPGHAISKTKAYKAWSQVVHCTTNPKSRDFIPGLAVHRAWRDFQTFLADVGQPPSETMAFVRLDKSRGFEPGNCAWISRSEAARMSAKSQQSRKNAFSATVV